MSKIDEFLLSIESIVDDSLDRLSDDLPELVENIIQEKEQKEEEIRERIIEEINERETNQSTSEDIGSQRDRDGLSQETTFEAIREELEDSVQVQQDLRQSVEELQEQINQQGKDQNETFQWIDETNQNIENNIQQITNNQTHQSETSEKIKVEQVAVGGKLGIILTVLSALRKLIVSNMDKLPLIFTGLMFVIYSIKRWFHETLTGWWDSLTDTITGWWNSLTNTLTGWWKGLTGWFTDTVDKIKERFGIFSSKSDLAISESVDKPVGDGNDLGITQSVSSTAITDSLTTINPSSQISEAGSRYRFNKTEIISNETGSQSSNPVVITGSPNKEEKTTPSVINNTDVHIVNNVYYSIKDEDIG